MNSYYEYLNLSHNHLEYFYLWTSIHKEITRQYNSCKMKMILQSFIYPIQQFEISITVRVYTHKPTLKSKDKFHVATLSKFYSQFCCKTFVADLRNFKCKISWPQIAVVSEKWQIYLMNIWDFHSCPTANDLSWQKNILDDDILHLHHFSNIKILENNICLVLKIMYKFCAANHL